MRSNGEETYHGKTIYSFKLIFPGPKIRTYYLKNEKDRDLWVQVLKEAVGYTAIEEFYDIKGDIGQGKFGTVKLAVHKAT